MKKIKSILFLIILIIITLAINFIDTTQSLVSDKYLGSTRFLSYFSILVLSVLIFFDNNLIRRESLYGLFNAFLTIFTIAWTTILVSITNGVDGKSGSKDIKLSIFSFTIPLVYILISGIYTSIILFLKGKD